MRVNLARFIRGPQVIDQRLLAAHVALEGVPHFVREHLHVALGAVEVGENVRQAHRGERGAESARRFAFAILEIGEVAAGHQAEEIIEPAADRVEHFLGSGDQPIVIVLAARDCREDRERPRPST